MLTAHRGMHLAIVVVEEAHEEISNGRLKMHLDLCRYVSIIRRWDRALLAVLINTDFRGRRARRVQGQEERGEE